MDGKDQNKRILILCLLFLSTAIVSFLFLKESTPEEKKYVLKNFPKQLHGWKGKDIPISLAVLQELDNDDYLSRQYIKENQTVNLYIGYNYTLNKIGKIHSPLVCFPGQGWVISQDNQKKLPRVDDTYTINARTLIAQKGDTRELVLFWYQAYDKTRARTLTQKTAVFYNKLFLHKEDNAFVRITASINDKNDTIAVLERFVENFYPEFMTYIKS